MPTKITTQDVRVDGDKIVVSGAAAKALATSLVQKHTETMAEIAGALGFVHPKDISITSDGSVQIDNAKAAQKVKQLSQGPSGSNVLDTNCSCR